MNAPEFWFSIGSTYSYLTISRIPDLESSTGLRFDWRPFSVREIMVEMDNIPFARKPVKADYMWRDIERRALGYGLRPVLPAPYPLGEFDLANRIAIIAREEGWLRAYVIETYRQWFENGREAGGADNLRETFHVLGQDVDSVIEKANSETTGVAYRKATQEARERNIFGVPSFVVDGELFWGDDRLEDAISWAKLGKVSGK